MTTDDFNRLMQHVEDTAFDLGATEPDDPGFLGLHLKLISNRAELRAAIWRLLEEQPSETVG